MWDLLVLVGRVVLGVVLALVLAGGALFAYICFKARAHKWGAGCLAITILALLGLWWDIFLL